MSILVDDNNTREDELFVPSFTGVFSLSYNWDKINTSIDWTLKLLTLCHCLLSLIRLKEQRNPLGFLNTKCKSKVFGSLTAFMGVKNVFNYTQESPLVIGKIHLVIILIPHTLMAFTKQTFLFGLSVKL